MIYPVVPEKTKALPVYITGIGVSGNFENIDRPNGFPYSHILFITKGKGKFFCGGEEHELKKGVCYFFKRNIPHRYYLEGNNFENRWITFDGYFADAFFSFMNEKNFGIFTLKDLNGFSARFEKMYTLIKNPDECSHEKASSILYSMMIEMYSQMQSNDAKKDKNAVLKLIIEYIDENYSANISLDYIEDALGISKYTLCKIFKEQLNTSIFTYIIKYRLQKAKLLLSSRKDLTVKEIAFSVGFNDASYFTSQFRKHENISPAAFRKNWK